MKQSGVTSDITIICGLTTALALEQRGFSLTVYEAASEYRPVGAGILLQTNVLLGFERCGIADRILSVGVPLDDTCILSPSGRILQRFDLDDVERMHFGYGYVAIHRGDLQQILLNELDSPVKTGKVCAEVEGTDSPTARFEDKTRIQPDLVVGADGINSNVRDAIVPDIELRTLDTPSFGPSQPVSYQSDTAPGTRGLGERDLHRRCSDRFGCVESLDGVGKGQ